MRDESEWASPLGGVRAICGGLHAGETRAARSQRGGQRPEWVQVGLVDAMSDTRVGRKAGSREREAARSRRGQQLRGLREKRGLLLEYIDRRV